MSNDYFKQGTYKPINPKKYIGKELPKYRSSWELKLFLWLDQNINVLEWCSEGVVIPYMCPTDGKLHRYYTDCAVVIKEGPTTHTKYIIEVKPKKQTEPPTVSKKKKKETIIYESLTWTKNQAKWKAAKEWCSKHGYKFLILTEEHLFQTSK